MDRSLFDAYSEEEINATVAGLSEMGLFRLPFPQISIRFNTANWNRLFAPSLTAPPGIAVTFEHVTLDFSKRVHAYDLNGSLDLSPAELGIAAAECHRSDIGDGTGRARNQVLGLVHALMKCLRLLICSLATRNVIKQTTTNKRAALGIGRRQKSNGADVVYISTTTVSVPEKLDDDPDHPPGKERCPHLRRGHIRRQHHGHGNTEIKKIWIAPVFVNADAEWVGRRREYRVLSGADRNNAAEISDTAFRAASSAMPASSCAQEDLRIRSV